MKILLTGASGFLGGHIAELLAAEGHEVRGLVRRTSDTALLDRLGVEVVAGDLKDRDSLRRAVRGVDAVIHAAATMTGPAQEFEHASVKGTRALLSEAVEAGVKRFVHVSSIAVLSARGAGRSGAVGEDAPYEDREAFLGVYAASKIDAERAVIAEGQRSEIDVIVLRPGLLYGPRGKWVLPRMGYALGENLFVLVGMGGNRLPVCYVRNCARAAVLAAEKTEAGSGVFNIVDDEPIRQIEYLKRLKRDVRARLKIMRVPYVAARAIGWASGIGMRLLGRNNPIAASHLIACVKRVTYSSERAKRDLGWQPTASKEEALAETMRGYAERERVSRRADLSVLGRPVAGETPVTACLVGCGVIADAHLRILKRMEHAKVLALCDVNRESALALAKRYGVPRTYSDVAEMIDAETPGVLHILTPPGSHARYAELAAAQGCHVLVEKPMAMDAAEARRMADSAAERGVRLCVDHNHLFDPVVVRARRIIESGALGRILWVDSYYGFNLADNPNSRYTVPGGEAHWTFQLPGGLYQNVAPHPLSLAVEFLGAPTRVHAHARYGRVLPHAPTDELRILLETPSASGLVTVSLAASPREQYLHVIGTRRSLFVDILNKWLVTQGTIRGLPKPISRAVMSLRKGCTIMRTTLGAVPKVLCKKWTPYDGMEVLLREFYTSLQNGTAPPVSVEDGLRVMDIMDEAWRLIGTKSLKWDQECRP